MLWGQRNSSPLPNIAQDSLMCVHSCGLSSLTPYCSWLLLDPSSPPITGFTHHLFPLRHFAPKQGLAHHSWGRTCLERTRLGCWINSTEGLKTMCEPNDAGEENFTQYLVQRASEFSGHTVPRGLYLGSPWAPTQTLFSERSGPKLLLLGLPKKKETLEYWLYNAEQVSHSSFNLASGLYLCITKPPVKVFSQTKDKFFPKMNSSPTLGMWKHCS